MRITAASVLVGLILTAGAPAARQGLVGVQANWKDLETWSRLVEGTKENELGLGLQPVGPALIAFLGRLSIANPRQAPREVRVHVAPTYMANSTVLRTPTLIFIADAATDDQVKIDIGAAMVTDDPSPGGIINNGMASMRAADFVRLTRAKTLNANILGFDVTFRPDQIRAMQQFAERLHLVTAPPGSGRD